MLKKLVILAALFAIMLTGCQKKTEQEEVKEEFTGAREVKVTIARIGDISSYIEFSGKIEAEKTVNIAPSMSGRIAKLIVDVGSVVKKGDLLAKLDDTQLKQAKTQYDNMEKNYKRMQELQKTGAIDGATFDEVEAGYKVAKSSYEFMLENTEIKAPINGVVSLIFKKEGEHYDAMIDPMLLRMLNLDEIKAKIQVSDADVNKIKKGQKAILSVSSSVEEFTGRVSFVSPEADMMSGTFNVEITVQNAEGKLKHNQFTRIRLLYETSEDAVIIQQKAVLESEFVFVVQNEKAIKKYVSLGLGNEYEIEVIDGIKEGEIVITNGSIGLSDGDKVEISR
ncbi:MAG: efflux RND transporter periplasmic adaptor subunit [Candidatus Cloacimonetes bacterium]|nr:efflux RND transporter periplasmic adaptor subunit [Candidatus Cloacimonadota bacterium]MBL7149548.1 efflux RND transporter periplasmic adaptor subunit [Candidatus Cloacimonadota bacterium]